MSRPRWPGLAAVFAAVAAPGAAAHERLPPEVQQALHQAGVPAGGLPPPGLAGMAGEVQASTAELADREVQRWFAEHCIPIVERVLDSGSGLSRSGRITPLQMALIAAGRG